MIIFQKPFSQKSIASVLIIAITLLIIGPILLLPRKVNAAVGCPTYEVASVPTAAQTAKDSAYQAIDEAYQVGGLSEAIITAAEIVWDNAQKLVEWAYGTLLNILLHQILAQLTNEIVNYIQNYPDARFMEEGLGDFLWDAADQAAGTFIDQYLGLGWLCEPFDVDIRVALLEVPTFEEEVECSLSDIVDNIEDFYEDFSEGGWKGWIELTKPQNNFYGALLLAQGEKMRVEEEAKKELESEAQMGGGFLGQKKCYWYDASGALIETQDDVRGIPSLPDACQTTYNEETGYYEPTPGVVTPCKPQCETLTPATVINEMANKAITNFYDQINEQIGAATAKAGPYQIYVQAIVNALINKVITEGVGLLKAEDEEVPDYGDLGASEDIPEIADPEEAMQDQADAESLSSQLELLEDYANDFLDEQETNLAVLELIPDTYENDVIPALDSVITGYCSSTHPSYVEWAEDEKDNIENDLIPSYDDLIDQLEDDISETISLISNITSATSLVEDYIAEVDAWSEIWEEVNGDEEDDDLINAQDEMDEAETSAIENIQEILETINGTYSSDDFDGLNSEITTAITNLVTETLELEEDRGNADWPEDGTLYGELEEAYDLEEEADEYYDECYDDYFEETF